MEILAPGMGQAATFWWGSIHPIFLAQEQQSHWGRGSRGAQEIAGVIDGHVLTVAPRYMGQGVQIK